MPPLGSVIFGALIAAIAAVGVVGYLRTRLRNPADALAALRRALAKQTARSGIAEIGPGAAYPFSVEMIKEVAELEGYEFVDVFGRQGVSYLRFRARRRGRSAVDD